MVKQPNRKKDLNKLIFMEKLMRHEAAVFEKTYQYYLQQLQTVSLATVAPRLGAQIDGNALVIRLFNVDYTVSAEKITDPSGKKPPLDLCVILSKYLLRCPAQPPAEGDWVTFRNFKEAGPLVTYFSHEVEHDIASCFSERRDALEKASADLGGYRPNLDVRCDWAAQFDALPMIPVVILFNDKDEAFPAACSVLFERRTEIYLDAECIAMLGRQLSSRLRKRI